MAFDRKTSRDAQPADFRYFYPLNTRWMDNDVYGHVNNVVYYSFFDTAVNAFLIREAGLDIQSSDIVAYVVESQCSYFRPIAYPEEVIVAVRVDKLGGSSVTYGIGVFKKPEVLMAFGTFVHVFVQRTNSKPVQIPASIRSRLESLLHER